MILSRAEHRQFAFEHHRFAASAPQRIGAMSDNEIYILLFPEKEASNVIYAEVDYDYVTAELKRTGVTMKLLHEEYTDRCRTDGTLDRSKESPCSFFISSNACVIFLLKSLRFILLLSLMCWHYQYIGLS